jgi:bacterioferritin-associated ferredoxin
MYVCVCLAVTESEVQGAIEAGATTQEAVTRACRAGGDCGACHGMIATMIEDHAEARGLVSCCPPAAGSTERLIREDELRRTKAA